MLNFRSAFKAQNRTDGPVDTSIRRRRSKESPPPSTWVPPEPILKVSPTPAARAAFALFEAQTNYTLDDFIQMRVERLKRYGKPDWAAVMVVNNTYACRGEAEIPHIWRLLYDELSDWTLHDQRDRDAARPLTYLAACMWKLGDLDKAASAGSNAEFSIKYSDLNDEDLRRLAQGFYGLGMFYWGIDLTYKLEEAAQLGASYDSLLGGQFSVQVLQALAQLEELRGDHAKAKDYRDRATIMLWTSPAMKLPKPVWQVKVPPGGPYPVDRAESL